MDNRLGDIETFLMVASEGSFASAAKALRLTPSAVSRSIARLEQRLGVTLLRRTTRALALTREGAAYRDRMTVLLSDMMELEAGLGEDRGEPRGLLRVNASPSFGIECLIPLLPRFRARYPGVRVDLTLSDMIVDHAGELGLDPQELKRLWLHQANINMNQLIGKKVLGREPTEAENVIILDDYANTSSAGSIIAFHLHNDGFAPGETGLICSFGAGYSAGTVFVRKRG